MWIEKAPTQAGFYWAKDLDNEGKLTVIDVNTKDGVIYFPGVEVALHIDLFNGLIVWDQPITPPPETQNCQLATGNCS